jgi:hypothetical protein
VRLTKPSTVAPDDSAPPDTSAPVAPPLLGSSWSSITGGPPKQYIPPLKNPPNPVLDSSAGPAAQQRIWDAAKAGFEASRPDILPETGPLSRPELEKYPANRAFNLPALDLVRNALGLLGGAYGGAQQVVKENFDELRPATDLVGRLDPTGTGFGKVSGASPLSNAVVTAPDAFAGSPRTFADITETAPFVPPDPRTPVVIGVRNAAAAIDRGRIGYQNLHQSNLVFDPEFVDGAISGIVPEDPQALARAKLAGPSAVTDAQLNLQSFKGQPLSIQQYQGLMQGLSDAIETETKGGMTPAGKKLLEMRRQLKDRFETATPADVSSGNPNDIDTLLDANKSTFQGFKMQDMENMWNKAKMTENPTASMKTQVKNFVNDEADMRGWSPEEKAALERAGERGAWGTIYYGLGTGLGKAAGMGVGAYFGGTKGGPLGMLGGMWGGNVAGNLASQPFRAAANRIGLGRLQDALDVLGQSVPRRPLPLPEPEPPPAAQPNLPF